MRLLCVSLVTLLPLLALAEPKRTWVDRAYSDAPVVTDWFDFQENDEATYAIDDDLASTWVADAVGRKLIFQVPAQRNAKSVKLIIFTGNQRSPEHFADYGAPTTLTVAITDPTNHPSFKKTITLEPKLGGQAFTFEPDRGLGIVELTVDAARAGATKQGIAISEVQIFIEGTAPYDPRFELANRESLLAWKSARRERAAFLKAPPPSWPFISPTWERKELADEVLVRRWLPRGELDTFIENPAYVELPKYLATKTLPDSFDADDRKAMLEVIDAAKTAGKKARWYTIESTPLAQLPDGLEHAMPSTVSPLLRVSEFTLKGTPTKSLTQGPSHLDEELNGSIHSLSLSNALLLAGTPQAPQRVLVRQRDEWRMRTNYEETTWLLLEWKDGLLSRMATFGEANANVLERAEKFRQTASVMRFEWKERSLAAFDDRGFSGAVKSLGMGDGPDEGLGFWSNRWSPK